MPLPENVVTGASGHIGNTNEVHIAVNNLPATYAIRAPDWTIGRAYVVGELVANAGTLYRTITAHTAAGVFDATKFTAIGGGGGGGGLTTEEVQDIVGAMATDTATIDFVYDDPGNTVTASVKAASITAAMLAAGVLNEVMVLAIGDETTAITTGVAKVTFRMPFAMTVTSVRASLSTASTAGLPTFDVNEAGVSIFGANKLTIDANEKTSTTAATAADLTDTTLADDAEITVDIDVAGTGAKGPKVYLIGRRT